VLYILALCVAPKSVQAVTILSENFDELTTSFSVTSVGAFSAINGTNVDIVGHTLLSGLCATPESGNCVDLDGTGGNPQGILRSNTPITLRPGIDSRLSFDLIGSQRGLTTSTTVNFGPYHQTFVLASDDVSSGIVSNVLVTVSVPTVANLTFTSNTGGQIGALLDDVLITSAVPEPSTALLVAVGLGSMSVVGRRGCAPGQGP
jgi:hypothetical protein